MLLYSDCRVGENISKQEVKYFSCAEGQAKIVSVCWETY